MATTRDPKPGEKCVCGEPAVVVTVTKLGQVPSCVRPQLGKAKPHPLGGAQPSWGER